MKSDDDATKYSNRSKNDNKRWRAATATPGQVQKNWVNRWLAQNIVAKHTDTTRNSRTITNNNLHMRAEGVHERRHGGCHDEQGEFSQVSFKTTLPEKGATDDGRRTPKSSWRNKTQATMYRVLRQSLTSEPTESNTRPRRNPPKPSENVSLAQRIR